MATDNYTQEAEFKRLAEQVKECDQLAVMKKLIEVAFSPTNGLSSHRMEILAVFTAELIRAQAEETATA